jgi:hypothetical protein
VKEGYFVTDVNDNNMENEIREKIEDLIDDKDFLISEDEF